jgi:hypothetical protein
MSTQYWTAWIGEGDETCALHTSEAGAIGAVIDEINANYEPGEYEVDYTVAPMLSAHDVLRGMNHESMGQRIFQWVEEWLNDEMLPENPPLKVKDRHVHMALGRAIAHIICEHTEPEWWTVDTKNERKETYVAGSNDVEGQKP